MVDRTDATRKDAGSTEQPCFLRFPFSSGETLLKKIREEKLTVSISVEVVDWQLNPIEKIRKNGRKCTLFLPQRHREHRGEKGENLNESKI